LYSRFPIWTPVSIVYFDSKYRERAALPLSPNEFIDKRLSALGKYTI